MNRLFKIIFIGLLVISGANFIYFYLNSPESQFLTGLGNPATSEIVPVYQYRVVNIYPHDRNASTQGLVYENNILYEGTGLNGRSTIRKVDLKTGDIILIHKLPDKFFGEGITVYENKIIQLTWKSNIGFVYDRNNFELIKTFNYSTEGWGITHDGKRLIMSDGTSILHFLNPETFEEIGQVEVFDNNGSVTRLNELEYVQGEIYANIWQTDYIARIDPDTGKVAG